MKYRVVETIIRVMSSEESDKRIKKLLKNPELFDKEPEFTVYVKSFQEVSRILSQSKLELMQELTKHPNSTINELAEELKRKQEAISRDIKSLKSDRLIETIKEGRNVHCSTKTNKISIALV